MHVQVMESSDCRAAFQNWANARPATAQAQRAGNSQRHVSFAQDTKLDDTPSCVQAQPTSFTSSNGIAASRAIQQLADAQLPPPHGSTNAAAARIAPHVSQPSHHAATGPLTQASHQLLSPGQCTSSGCSHGLHEEMAQLRMEREHIAAVRANMEQSMRALEQERQAFEAERVRSSCQELESCKLFIRATK